MFVCVSVSVCVFVCVDCYSCSRINEGRFYRLLVMFSWILIRGLKIMLRSLVLLTWNAIIAAFSEECVAKLVH